MNEKRKLHSNRLVDGSVKNYEEYKYITGEIKGIDDSKNIVTGLYREFFAGKDT
jgi:hypothetical protein